MSLLFKLGEEWKEFLEDAVIRDARSGLNDA